MNRTSARKPAPFVGATEKQLQFLVTLAVERGWTYNNAERTLTNPAGVVGKLDDLSKAQASATIDNLIKTPKVHAPKRDSEPQITEAGMYRMDGVIYKVQVAVHGSGRLYAKQLIVDREAVRDEHGKIVEPAEVHFERVPGAVFRLRNEHRMSKEEATQFGALYGTCCVCGRTLTKEESIDAGIGPVCAGRV